jgi:hypothetical protein
MAHGLRHGCSSLSGEGGFFVLGRKNAAAFLERSQDVRGVLKILETWFIVSTGRVGITAPNFFQPRLARIGGHGKSIKALEMNSSSATTPNFSSLSSVPAALSR